MTNGRKEKLSWAAPKLQRMSAVLAEQGAPSAISDAGNNSKS